MSSDRTALSILASLLIALAVFFLGLAFKRSPIVPAGPAVPDQKVEPDEGKKRKPILPWR